MPSAFEIAFAQVQELVATFRDNESYYQSAEFSEAQARKDFIDKFFVVLGWDVNHEAQKNPYEQEVKVERNELGSQRRADYAFFLLPNFRDVRFFVEAKKPHGEFGSPDNYFQTIRYGWGNQTPIAVLTNFDEFHVLDCRYEPNIGDTLSRVVKKFTFTDYADSEKFAEIYWLFSREAVANGSLTKYAETLPRPKSRTFRTELFKRADQPPDESFLNKLDEYREALAKAFKAKNPDLNGAQLTEVTQRTLDRLVFIRFLEDKLIEPQRRVERFGMDGKNTWEDFISAAFGLDRIYNGIVFKRHDILDAPGFQVDEKAFSRICENISDHTSPYNFDSIPIYILASIYERFLCKIITDDASVVEKPEVLKAGGIYYTPAYIVRYIISNTIGKLIEGKTPTEVSEMRFADIACGSGSFLLEVFDLLLRHHTKFFNENPSKAKKGDCVKRDDGLHLSLKKKQEILRNNIYGVDIDRQAVEVTQLSLYLKLLEDETLASAHAFQTEFHYTLLPSLSDNIVCGNSLIGMDIFEVGKFSPEEEKRLNPMDYDQRFPKIMERGGFDAIIGNPPWISLSGKFGNEFLPPGALAYLISNYQGNTYMPNMYEYFVAKGLTLTRKDGLFGYIVPDRLGFNSQFIPLRKKILTEAQIESLLYKVPFPGIVADTLVFIFRQRTANPTHEVAIAEYDHAPALKRQTEILAHPEHCFEFKIDTGQDQLVQRIIAMPNVKPLSEVASCTSGFGGKSQLITNTQRNKSQIQTLKGDSIGRYEHRKGYWFEFRRDNITGRTTNKKKLGAKPKVLLRKTGDSIIATFDDSGIFPEQSLYFLYAGKMELDFKYLLGVINSNFMNWFFKKNCLTNEQSIAQVKTVDLVKLPIRTIDFSDATDKSRHDKMVSLVEQILAAKKQVAMAKTDADHEFYRNRCNALDNQIDTLVCELYDLSSEDIALLPPRIED
jgi:type I restriction-modification system DNA methylase subunit